MKKISITLIIFLLCFITQSMSLDTTTHHNGRGQITLSINESLNLPEELKNHTLNNSEIKNLFRGEKIVYTASQFIVIDQFFPLLKGHWVNRDVELVKSGENITITQYNQTSAPLTMALNIINSIIYLLIPLIIACMIPRFVAKKKSENLVAYGLIFAFLLIWNTLFYLMLFDLQKIYWEYPAITLCFLIFSYLFFRRKKDKVSKSCLEKNNKK